MGIKDKNIIHRVLKIVCLRKRSSFISVGMDQNRGRKNLGLPKGRLETFSNLWGAQNICWRFLDLFSGEHETWRSTDDKKLQRES